MSNISEESGNNLGDQKSTRPARFTKIATYIGMLGWLCILSLPLMQQISPAGNPFDSPLSPEDTTVYWVTDYVMVIAQLSALFLVLPGLIFALVGTIKGERGRWLATAWLAPASIVPLYIIWLNIYIT